MFDGWRLSDLEIETLPFLQGRDPLLALLLGMATDAKGAADG